MPLQNFQYFAGPNPGESDHAGNGRWQAKAADPDAAWRAILSTVTFPGEMVGRFEDVFVPGVSLPGRACAEVIQLWNNDPAVGARTAEFGSRWIKRNPPHSHHFAFPYGSDSWRRRFGLVMEIPVERIADYLAPVVAMPASLAFPAPGDRTALSPIGQLAAGVTLAHRQRLQLAVQDARVRQARSQLEIEESAGAIRLKMRALNQQLAVLNTYVHGMTGVEIVRHGERAPAAEPYRILQSRLYLDQEIGLLVNLVDMDFTALDKLDEWLEATGHWRKLLPFPKTVLVTRVRKEKKDYGNFLSDIIGNHFNMANVVWIRDGDLVLRFNTEIQFDDAIFRSSDEEDRVTQRLAEAIYERRFKGREPGGKRTRVGVGEGGINEETPYERRVRDTGFRSLEAWMASDCYTAKIQAELREAARQYVTGKNLQRMPFLVLLQGMIDGSTILNIPAGTNLLDAGAVARYFHLVFDRERALPDSSSRKAFDARVAARSQKKGAWVIARADRERELKAKFYQIVSVQSDDVTVRYTPHSRRYPYEPLTKQRTRKLRHFLPVAMPDELIQRLLDDREWKLKHVSWVPILALWSKVQRHLRSAVKNESSIDLGRGLDVIADGEGNSE